MVKLDSPPILHGFFTIWQQQLVRTGCDTGSCYSIAKHSCFGGYLGFFFDLHITTSIAFFRNESHNDTYTLTLNEFIIRTCITRCTLLKRAIVLLN